MAQQPGKQETEEKQPTLEDILEELPIPDEHRKALTNLFTNLASSVFDTRQQLAVMSAKLDQVAAEGSKATAEAYKGLSAEQIYNIELAKATAPAQQAQYRLLEAMTGAGRNPGGGLDELIKDADRLNALRSIFSPQPTALQVATEKAQVAQMLAQTRLMNKVVGKQVDGFLESIEKDLGKEE